VFCLERTKQDLALGPRAQELMGNKLENVSNKTHLTRLSSFGRSKLRGAGTSLAFCLSAEYKASPHALICLQ